MARFKDSKGTRWDVSIDFGTLEDIRDNLEIDLGQPGNFETHRCNLIDVCNMLYVICQQQATERGITDEAFGKRLAGDALDRGREALDKAFLSFLPRRQKLLVKRFLSAADRMGKVKVSIIEKMESHLKEQAKKGTLSRSDTSWQEFLESTPGE